MISITVNHYLVNYFVYSPLNESLKIWKQKRATMHRSSLIVAGLHDSSIRKMFNKSSGLAVNSTIRERTTLVPATRRRRNLFRRQKLQKCTVSPADSTNSDFIARLPYCRPDKSYFYRFETWGMRGTAHPDASKMDK